MARLDLGRFALAAFAVVVASRFVLLLAYHPDTSDIPHYERYATVVAAMAAEKVFADSPGRDGDASGSLAVASSSALLEYPPVAVAFMAAVGIGGANTTPVYPDAYADHFRTVVFGVDVLIIFALIVATSKLPRSNSSNRKLGWSLLVYGVAGAALAYVVYDRLDLIVGAFLLFSILLLVRGSWRSSFLLLALAIAFKAVPLVLAPLWVVGSLPVHQWARAPFDDLARVARTAFGRALFLAAAVGILFAPFVIAVGSRAFDFVRFNAARGIQIESTASSILMLFHALGLPIRVVLQFGALELVSPPVPAIATLSPLLVVLAVTAATVAYGVSRHRPGRLSAEGPSSSEELVAASDPDAFVATTLLILLVTVVLSKVLSPQYLLWFVPIVPLLVLDPVRGAVFKAGFVTACFVSTAIYPVLYLREFERLDPNGGYLDPGGLGVGVLLFRNVILVGLVLLLVHPKTLAHRGGQSRSIAGSPGY